MKYLIRVFLENNFIIEFDSKESFGTWLEVNPNVKVAGAVGVYRGRV